MRFTIKGIHILFILCFFSIAGCSYIVNNDQNRIYSISNYGEDKFIQVGNLNIHYVEAGEGGTRHPHPRSLQYLQALGEDNSVAFATF